MKDNQHFVSHTLVDKFRFENKSNYSIKCMNKVQFVDTFLIGGRSDDEVGICP